MKETWLPVVGSPSYEVSSCGRVRSVDRFLPCADGRTRRFCGQLLVISTDDRGYQRVRLYEGGTGESRTVHSLVAEAFIGPCPPDHEVRHDDGDPSENSVGNLLYGTRSQNMQDSVRHGTHANANKVTCKRGHRLIEPNLVLAKIVHNIRECLACARTRAWMQTHPHDDRDAVADRYYVKIMENAA